MSKVIKNHKAVLECESAVANGFDHAYKYDVFLKEGWVFENGRTAGCRSGVFRNVAEFFHARPIRK